MGDPSKEEYSDPYEFPGEWELSLERDTMERIARYEQRWRERLLYAHAWGQISAPNVQSAPKNRRPRKEPKRKEMQIPQCEATKRQKGKVSCEEEVQAEKMNIIEQDVKQQISAPNVQSAPKNRRAQKEPKRKEMQIPECEATKRQKGKVSCEEEVQAEKMNIIEQVANAIMRSTLELVKSTQRLPIPENQIWKNVVELNLDPSYKMQAYLFLIRNPDMLGALLGCPLEERKELLMNMISH